MDITTIKPLALELLPAQALEPLHNEIDPAFSPKQRELIESVFIGLLNGPVAKACAPQVLAQAAIVVVVQLTGDLGGFSYYIPRGFNLRAVAIRRAIKRDFTGRNHVEVARKHGVTEVWVRRVLAKSLDTTPT